MITSTRLSSVFVLDQDQALDFYVGVLGLEVHTDAQVGASRWLTVCAPGERSRQILLELPGPPELDGTTADQVRSLVTKGAGGGWLAFLTDDPFGLYEALVAKGVDITDEISTHGYGTDFGIRDPFGNRIRFADT